MLVIFDICMHVIGCSSGSRQPVSWLSTGIWTHLALPRSKSIYNVQSPVQYQLTHWNVVLLSKSRMADPLNINATIAILMGPLGQAIQSPVQLLNFLMSTSEVQRLRWQSSLCNYML